MRLQSSCLLVTTFSLHHCIWDCHPVLSLTAFTSYWLCCKVALSCLIDTGVILKPGDWSATVLCMPLIKTILGLYSSSHDLPIRGSAYNISYEIFYLWSVNTYRLAPYYPFWTLKFQLWLVVQFCDTVIVLCDGEFWLTNAIGLYLSSNGLTHVCLLL